MGWQFFMGVFVGSMLTLGLLGLCSVVGAAILNEGAKTLREGVDHE